MAYGDDFRELIADARDAVDRLLDQSRHDAWVNLRAGYGEMCRALASDDKARKLEELASELAERRNERETLGAEERDRRDRWQERRDVWRLMPRARRESLLFTALGDERLTIREIALRMNAQLGYAPEDRVVPEYETRPLVRRLFRNGHVEREPETFNKTRTRYRYFRKRGLAGPIVDLERAYHDDTEVA
jgi:hypothetical protein